MAKKYRYKSVHYKVTDLVLDEPYIVVVKTHSNETRTFKFKTDQRRRNFILNNVEFTNERD